MKNIVILMLFFVASCNVNEPIPSRDKSPEGAFQAARAALRNHDMVSHFDALTDSAVMDILDNSIVICRASKKSEVIAAGLRPSIGCDKILERYQWPMNTKNSSSAFKSAAASVSNLRELTADLERSYRDEGLGSSFSWTYLDDVSLSNIVIDGNHARATANWSSENREVQFEKDSTGWRFDPMLGER